MMPADFGHAVDLAPLLRQADEDELRAATGREPLPVLVQSVEMSAEAWAVYIDGELACLWGVVPLSETLLGGRVGIGWMLTTEVVERRAKTFWRACCELLPAILRRWDVLTNAIDMRHEQAIRWADRLGFKLEAPIEHGSERLPFAFFEATYGALRV